MLNSIYHMALNLLKNRIFDLKTSIFFHLLRNVVMDVITLLNLLTTSCVSILLHGVISLPDMTSYEFFYK